MIAIQAKCPHCGERIEAEQAGTVTCPACLFETEVEMMEPEPDRQVPSAPIWERPRRPGLSLSSELLTAAAAVLIVGSIIGFVILAGQAGEEGFEMLKLIFLLVVGLPVYFVPSMVAWKRRHRNATAIIVLNIFLGWTFIGWVVALVWALYKSEVSAD